MPNIIHSPPTNWVERLRRDNMVWLYKERRETFIDYPYEAAEPGFQVGRIGIRGSGGWYVGLNGEGLNGKPLIQPIEGNLPDNPEPLPEPLIRQMQRAIEKLNNRVRALEHSSFYDWQPGDAELFNLPPVVPKFVSELGLEIARLNPGVCIEDPCSYCNGTGKAIKPL
jgi:hypothetical protein